MRKVFFFLLSICLFKSAICQDQPFYFMTSDTVPLYVRVAGKGFPCLFLHGGPGSTSYYFEALPAAKRIEQSVQMIYFDQRGSGRSGISKQGAYSLQRMEKDIEELREFLKIKEWSIMGHSFAGILMTSYAKHYPVRVRRLIYVHCTLNLEESFRVSVKEGAQLLTLNKTPIQPDQHKPLMEQLREVNEALEKEDIRYRLMFRTKQAQLESDSLTNAATSEFNRDYANYVWRDDEYFKDFSIYTLDITCPVLIISGKKDYAAGPGNFKQWGFKDMKVREYNGGHVSFQEEPAWFVGHVLHFLEK